MSDDHHETGAWRVIEAGPAFADEMARVHAASIRGTCGSHYTGKIASCQLLRWSPKGGRVC